MPGLSKPCCLSRSRQPTRRQLTVTAHHTLLGTVKLQLSLLIKCLVLAERFSKDKKRKKKKKKRRGIRITNNLI